MGFCFDRALSRALVNKFKGQQGYTSFLAGNTANRAGDTVFVKKGRSSIQMYYNLRESASVQPPLCWNISG